MRESHPSRIVGNSYLTWIREGLPVIRPPGETFAWLQRTCCCSQLQGLRLDWGNMRILQPIRALVLDRHSHDAAYAAVVVAGSYEEAGDQGRFRVEAGGVLLHDRFEAHLDRFSRAGAIVLNLPLPTGLSFKPGAAKLADPDPIVMAAERSLAKATALLLSSIEAASPNINLKWCVCLTKGLSNTRGPDGVSR